MPPVTFMPQTVGVRTGFTTTERPAKIGVDPGRIWIVVTPFDSARSNAMSCAFTAVRSEEHTSELQSLMRNSYAVSCLKKQKTSHTAQKLQTTIIHITEPMRNLKKY